MSNPAPGVSESEGILVLKSLGDWTQVMRFMATWLDDSAMEFDITPGDGHTDASDALMATASGIRVLIPKLTLVLYEALGNNWREFVAPVGELDDTKNTLHEKGQ